MIRRAGTGGPLCWPFLQATPLFLQFTNRCLLKWLKLWDLVVFGRERPARRPRPGVELARGGKEAASSNKWKSHEQVLEDMLEAELDPSRRPRQKVRSCPSPVAVLSGVRCLRGLAGSRGTLSAPTVGALRTPACQRGTSVSGVGL